jgi:SIR2-like domain
MTDNKKIKYCLLGPSIDSENEDFLKSCESNTDAMQRLQALMAEWLRMENLVVLTAAGCSVDCGGKIMSNLESAVLNAVKCIPDNLVSKEAKKLIEERLKKEGEQKEDWAKTGFEEWLSFLVNAIYLGEESKSPISTITWKNSNLSIGEAKNFVSYIAKAIYAECSLALPDNTHSKDGEKSIAPHIAFLSKLVTRDSNLGRTHLFTLNYDTLFEQALELLGIQYFDGFTGRANARFDPSVYGLDVYYPGEIAEGRVRRFDKFLHFYKLHGSIHWRINNGELRARHEDLTKYLAYQNSTPEEKAKKLIEKDFAPDHQSFGILPTSNKFIQTLDMPYSHIFRALSARLSAPQTFLLVMGYGFGDDHVTKIIETALMNPALVMLVIEPNPESPTIKRILEYKELGKRAFILTPTDEEFQNNKFVSASFNDFAKNIMPDVQWLEDFLKLRRFEKQLQKNSGDKENPLEA